MTLSRKLNAKQRSKKMQTDKLKEYSRLLDSIAWHRQGDIFKLAKLAKELGRDYMQDLTDRKIAIAQNIVLE